MKNKMLAILVLAVCLISVSSQAAIITWGDATDVSAASDVINTGTLIEAINAGGLNSGSDQTANGVPFTGMSSLLDMDNDVDVFSGDTGDAAYNALLSSIDFGGGTGTVSLQVGGGKLTVGTEYTIQVWYVDTSNSRVTPVGDGEISPNKVDLNSTPGQFATGTFVANGGTRTITLESPGFGNAHITAYQIRGLLTPPELHLAEVQVWSGTPDNNPPVAIAQSVTVGKNTAKAITLSGTDVELETLTALIDTLPSHGTVSLAGNVATYQPAMNYLGADSFTFKMMDASSTGTAATVSITVESLLMAHWALDEGSGSVATDSSEFGRDGIIANGTWVTGIKGNALDFNGSSSTVILPSSTFSSIRDEITIAMWVYGDDTLPKSTSAIYAMDASGNRCLNIHLPFSNGIVYWDAGDSTGYDRIEKLATANQYKGAWNHWVFTKNATTGVMNIYLNGALWETGTGKTKSIGTITSATLGSQISDLFYDGVIDDVHVYKSALTAGEVYELYMKHDTLTVSNFTVGASNVLEWTAFPNHVYHVYWSSNLLSGFTLVGSNVLNGLFIDTSYASEPKGFYKLTAEPQP
jgi:hypothetical protein